MKAAEFFAKASDLVSGERNDQHGDMRVNMTNIAALWNAWLSIRRDKSAPLTGRDVCIMAAVLKIARMESGRTNLDDGVDSIGYLGMATQFDSEDIR